MNLATALYKSCFKNHCAELTTIVKYISFSSPLSYLVKVYTRVCNISTNYVKNGNSNKQNNFIDSFNSYLILLITSILKPVLIEIVSSSNTSKRFFAISIALFSSPFSIPFLSAS